MSGIDWPGLLRVGLHQLRLEPAVFWRLTPMELPRERFATFLQTESVRWKAAVDAAGAAKTME